MKINQIIACIIFCIPVILLVTAFGGFAAMPIAIAGCCLFPFAILMSSSSY